MVLFPVNTTGAVKIKYSSICIVNMVTGQHGKHSNIFKVRGYIPGVILTNSVLSRTNKSGQFAESDHF